MLEKNTSSANLDALNSAPPWVTKISPSQENGTQKGANWEIKLKETSNKKLDRGQYDF